MRSFTFNFMRKYASYFSLFVLLGILSTLIPVGHPDFLLSPRRIVFLHAPLSLIFFHSILSDLSNYPYFYRLTLRGFRHLAIGIIFSLASIQALFLLLMHGLFYRSFLYEVYILVYDIHIYRSVGYSSVMLTLPLVLLLLLQIPLNELIGGRDYLDKEPI